MQIPFIPVYLENARSTTATTLAFTIVTGGTWKIKVAQIECSSLARAYPDCDQFVTGASGTISSYNWANVQLRAKDYQHCIRREQGICHNFCFFCTVCYGPVTHFQHGQIADAFPIRISFTHLLVRCS